jgi:CRISPR/Cas system-associated exonuclease Cas4 (RecB family)
VLLCEHPVSAEWGEIPFTGKVDLVAVHDGLTYVIDLKTGAPPTPGPWFAKELRAKMLQPALYAAALEDEGISVDHWGLLFAPHNGPSKLHLDEPATSWVDAVLQHQQAAEDIIHTREEPHPSTSALCGWCPYVDRCPEGEVAVRERWRLNKSVGPAREVLGL